MAATSGSSGRRRFTPALLSTVKDSFRLPPEQKRPGPAPELTPEPSPTEEAPPPLESFRIRANSHTQTTNVDNPPREKRRFAPQLIETSRRCRRNGDTSPATRPADKTDITPWMNHIYVPKPRRRFLEQDGTDSTAPTTTAGSTIIGEDDESVSSNSDGGFFPQMDRIFSRRESMTADGLRQALEYERKEYARARKRREADALLAAFPNYNPAKYEGVEHFHARESSEDEQDRSEKKKEPPRQKRRRDSEVNWFAKEHQQHAKQVAEDRGEDIYHSHDDEDMVESPGHEGPPAAPLWVSGSAEHDDDVGPPPNRGPLGEFVMPLIPETYVTPFIPSRPTPSSPAPKTKSPAIRPIGEVFMPYIPSAPIGKAADMPYAPAPTPFSRAPAAAHNIGFRNVGTTPRNKVKVLTPPMAGQDLKFRRCESPQHTKMEPDHPFFPEPGKELHRDPTGEKGLWMGYCLAKDSKEVMVPAELQGPHMIATPQPPASPNLIATSKNQDVCEEPGRMWLLPSAKSSSPQSRTPEPKGVHLVAGLDERLKHEKELAELDEVIADEFGNPFVTQVYNYLSLGYPVMARDFDAELSKISHIPIEELRKDDAEIMSKGHMKLTMADDELDEDRGPRWHALKKYVVEWARQHPNLTFDGADPLHWGMRERRGSWAV